MSAKESPTEPADRVEADDRLVAAVLEVERIRELLDDVAVSTLDPIAWLGY